MQRHLDLPGSTDGVSGDTKTRRGRVQGIARWITTAISGCNSQIYIREGIVTRVDVHVSARDIEAAGVGEVVDVEGVFKGVPFTDFDVLDQRGICARFWKAWRKILR